MVGCRYFLPDLQLPPQHLRGLLPISLLGEQRHDGCEQFAEDCYLTASRLRSEPEPSAPEFSALTTRTGLTNWIFHTACDKVGSAAGFNIRL